MALLPGVVSEVIQTRRLRTHVLRTARMGGAPVVFVDGNISTARFWEEILATLPAPWSGIAMDLRGYGGSELRPVDATRGLRDFADDLAALLEALAVERPHLVGWSLGAGVVMQYALDHPGGVASLTLEAPLSPYGFGGTRDEAGTPCWPDYAGSGGGTANPEFVRRLREGDRTDESPFSPRNVMRAFYVKPPFRPAPEREEILVAEVLTTAVGDDNYPGDVTPSPHWPHVAPGRRGVNNAMSPAYCNLSGFARLTPKPPVLWIRGADDQIVSDTSLFDFGYLGRIGAVPGWPGEEVFPPQPMVSQTRAVLDAYRRDGGSVAEEVFPDCGHSPHLEDPERFRSLLVAFVSAATT
ncbi:MAG: alpha/beta fold hydrolase [Armatimonadota bacterium]|nr:alpha/beta fold hydrolase [Armatimonadota bacterium]MDR7447754.1 alpha/beta fold hydrolase [Armatimonadota bacterium]MDR7458531.1 alpha/beta fold hydrolase [Armatimonadota bacterium]MDR7479912.1 alpha/beta fold hydrolase [Armatimonadota bacterium]MDR7487740.1 alpha/beta fold hydrolase [Armatimonadota bacterium]